MVAAEARSEPLIDVEGLVKHYDGAAAVDGISLQVHPGEIFGLLGPNGAGKTTTILTLLGLTEPTRGKVRVCGLDPARDPVGVKRRVGYLPDAVGFYPDLTARQNLRYTARLNEIGSEEAEEEIDRRLDEVGLEDARDQLVGTFSRGMKQRLGVADVLLKDPSVVILDEPTASIDPGGVVEILGLISRLAHRDGRAVLLSSHLLNQVQEICDRVGIFVNGKMVTEGTPDSLAAHLEGSGAVYELWVDTDEPTLKEALAATTSAVALDVTETGAGRWRIVLPDRDISATIRALVESDLDVRQIRDLGSNLDQIYRRYFEVEEKALS